MERSAIREGILNVFPDSTVFHPGYILAITGIFQSISIPSDVASCHSPVARMERSAIREGMLNVFPDSTLFHPGYILAITGIFQSISIPSDVASCHSLTHAFQ
jgi:hypothetical protein